MFSNVSWSQYLTVMSLVLAAYYLLIGIRYYRTNIIAVLSGRWHSVRSGNAAAEVSTEELDAIVFDLRYAILEKAGVHTSKQELLRQFCQRLENYNGLRQPAFRVAINSAIIKHSKDSCGVEFSEAELNDAWDWIAPRG
jgi:hypothetical protein